MAAPHPLLASGGGGAALGVLVVIGIGLYFLPTVVAAVRHVPNIGSVIVINFFLGWSLIGWVIALAMAMRSAPAPHVVNVYGPPGVSPPAPPQTPGPTVAGWYPDPYQPGGQRYFDGAAWTGHTS